MTENWYLQRGHQNSLEVLATHYLLTVLVGIRVSSLQWQYQAFLHLHCQIS